MAEVIVNVMLSRLEEESIKKIMKDHGHDAEKVREKLGEMRDVLSYFGSAQYQGRTVNEWMKKVRDVAFELENFTHTVLLEGGKGFQSAQRKSGKMKCINWMSPKSKKMRAELNEIHDKIERISNEGRQFQSQLYQSDGSENFSRQPVIPEGFARLKARMKNDQENVVRLLLDERFPEYSVVAIVGPGGIGKTTLAQAVYHSDQVQSHFDIHLLIRVSQEHKMLDKFRNIATYLGVQMPANVSKGLRNIRSELKKKKYLIVLDDVCTDNQLTQFIGGIIPKNNNGSRVLITTRIPEIAKGADLACHIYTLRALSEEESLQLLLTYALKDTSEQCPNDLLELAQKIARKRRGYPQPLKMDGDMLFHLPFDFLSWSRAVESLNFKDDAPKRNRLEELPLVLKLCLLWFVVLPEIDNIDAKSLIRLWIADELIVSEDDKTIEATAERLLEKLVQMQLVQVSERYPNNSIKSCSLHDSLKDDDFLNGPNNVASSNFCHLLHSESRPSKSLLLELLGRNNSRVRYLELHWNWNTMEQGYFEKLVGGMSFLQTIDLRAGQHGDLPDFIWQFKMLRHVLLSGYTCGPPKEAHLEKLQTLTGITNRESWVAGVPNLCNLRVLDILLYRGFHRGRLASFVDGLKHLVSLKIVSEDIPLKVIGSYEYYQCLQSLHMREYRATINNITLSVDMIPGTLVELTLENFRLKQDLMNVLDKLLCLQRLRLGYRACENKKMCCHKGGFRQLKELELIALENLNEWKIMNGAMPKLQQLTVFCCPLLRVPEGLIYLTSLQKLSWAFHREHDKDGQIQNLKKHISGISIVELSQ